MDLKQFADRMDGLSKRFLTNTEKAVRKSALIADQRLVNSTPVDTGRARTNWLAGLNSPSRDVFEPQDVTGIMAINVAIFSKYRNGDVIYLSNNVHYIVYLNQGSSVQAPAMFVEEAVLAAVNVFRNTQYLRE